MIYFLLNNDDKRIKIGYTNKNPEKRRSILQVGSSGVLTLILAIEGTREDEGNLHDHFEEEHYRGEWFNPSNELLSLIEKLKLKPTTKLYDEIPTKEDYNYETEAEVEINFKSMIENERKRTEEINAISKSIGHFGGIVPSLNEEMETLRQIEENRLKY